MADEEGAPRHPTRPRTAFLLFCFARRENIRENNPETSFAEISRILGHEWKKSSESELAEFRIKAQEDRERYYKELEIFQGLQNQQKGEESPSEEEGSPSEEEGSPSEEEEEESRNKPDVSNDHSSAGGLGERHSSDSESDNKEQASGRKRQKRDPSAPKRPVSAYMIYVTENRTSVRDQNPTAPFSELAMILGAQWQCLPDIEREKYMQKAKEDKQRYTLEVQKYESKKQP